MNKTLDPLAAMYTPGTHPHAQVGFSVGTQFDFGRIKVTAHVNYTCDQTTQVVNETGELAFSKAVELMNDGLRMLLSEESKT